MSSVTSPIISAEAGNQSRFGPFPLGNPDRGDPMATVYQFHVMPHRKRLMQIREQRWERWHQLHDHDGRAAFWLAVLPALALFWAGIGYLIDRLI